MPIHIKNLLNRRFFEPEKMLERNKESLRIKIPVVTDGQLLNPTLLSGASLLVPDRSVVMVWHERALGS